MTIDWDQFGKDLDTAVAGGAKSTDDELASQISSLTRLKDDEIKALFPSTADLQKLSKLMTIVNSAGDQNSKTASIVSNIADFSGTILSLLTKFVA